MDYKCHFLLVKVVGVEGFEPPTYCSQSNRATRLRYTPLRIGRKAREYRRFTG